jgi:hypothetical protein
MERISDTQSPKIVRQEKLKESDAESEGMDSKIKNDKKLLVEDGKFISNLGWISILSVTIASIAVSL